MLIRVVGAEALDSSDGTSKYRSSELFNLITGAAVESLTIESEREYATSFYAIRKIQIAEKGVSSTNFSSDLRDVTIASKTLGVRGSGGCVLHIILVRNPWQIA